MGVTAYSVIVSVLFYNLSLIAVFLLRRSGAIQAKNTSALLLFFTFLGAVRLLTPLDFKGSVVIRSYKVLPAIENALNVPLLGPLSPGRILLLIWTVGTLVFIVRDLIRQRRYVLADKQLPLSENEQIARIAAEYGKGFRLKVSPEIDLPYVTGLLKPVIHLPDVDLSNEEWRNIFRHETQHIRSHDEWKKLFFRAIRAIFWWNPLVHLSEEDINLLIELQCDERVAGRGDPDEQESYLRTMMELMKRCIETEAPVGASRMIGKQKEMKIRFEALLAPETKRSKRTRVVLSVVLVTVFVASYFFIVQPIRLPSEDEISVYREGHVAYDVSSKLEEGEDQFILFEDGEYRLYINGEYVFAIDEGEYLSNPQFNTIPCYGG